MAASAKLAARVAVPLAVAWAAYKLAKTATNGLAVLSGYYGDIHMAEVAEGIGESITDKPDVWMAGARKASSVAMAWGRAKHPLGADAMAEIYEFGAAEERWKKQRERREKNQFGESWGEVIGFLTGFGGN
mgnify:FL=1